MKLLSVAIPCYNSAAYMGKCIESLLPGGDEVEIIVVNDGSQKDNTAEIADSYAAKYPSIVKAVHKENGGHGSAVNTGIANATGRYFKVVDSDDWVNAEAYAKILDTLRSFSEEGKELDMLVSNFVYEKEGEKNKRVMHYRHVLPQEKVFTWKDCHHFNKWNYILMHSVIFRTQMLKDSGLQLPEHTFYVDSLYVYESLMHVKNIFYIDVDFYRYYIGREDQSVNESVMISRMDQQVRVNKRMIDYYVENKEEIMKDKRLHQYMRSYLEVITIVTTVLCIRSGTEEHLGVRREIWQYMKGKDEKTFKRLRYGLMGTVMHLPGKLGRKISVGSYHICQKIFHFN